MAVGRSYNSLEVYRAHLTLKALYFEQESDESLAGLEQSLTNLMKLQKPACLRDCEENVITVMEKAYAKSLVTLQECGCRNPDQLTVYEQYTWAESMEEKYEASKPK